MRSFASVAAEAPGTASRKGRTASARPVTAHPSAGIDPAHLQRVAGNRAVVGLIAARSAPSSNGTVTVQRVGDGKVVATPPYPTTHAPPDFEYWVNSMWKQVKDGTVRDEVMVLLKGSTDAPQAGSAFSDGAKGQILTRLYNAAYKEAVWYEAEQLLKEGSLSHRIRTPTGKTIAAGFHGTARDPNTVLSAHKGTIPTIERHGKAATDSPGIQEHLKTKLGIDTWHPFWFGGEIAKRPFLFRNVEEDNELDTTISVANSAIDSLDFPMIDSDTIQAPAARKKLEDESERDPDGLPVIENYVYLVGVTQGFGTSKHLQGDLKFGEGEIATQKLDPDDHLGYVRYLRRFRGGSRNDGYMYERAFSDVLPGARRKNISSQVQGLLKSMPTNGQKNCTAAQADMKPMYASLEADGKKAALSALTLAAARRRLLWTPDQWISSVKIDAIATAPTPKAKRVREAAYLRGVMSVLGEKLPVPDQAAVDKAVADNNLQLKAPIVLADIGKPAVTAKPASRPLALPPPGLGQRPGPGQLPPLLPVVTGT